MVYEEGSRRAKLRLFFGFIALPIVDIVIALVVSPALNYSLETIHLHPSDPIGTAISLAVAVGIVSVFMTFGVVVPLVFWLLKRGPVSLRRTLLIGGVLGNLPLILLKGLYALVELLNPSPPIPSSLLTHEMSLTIRALSTGSVIGLASAATFWVIAIRGTQSDSGTHITSDSRARPSNC